MKPYILIFSIFLISSLEMLYAQRFDDVTIETIKVSDHVYMLVGAGGNVGVSVGNDGVFVIDDQFAPLTPKIEAAIKKLSDHPIKFLVNTHHHGDHTGGNENMQKLGATIIAHDNVRHRLETTPQRDSTMLPMEALPIITFNDQMSVFMNGEKIEVIHVDHAHTDGDVLLYFTESNVLHTGDTFFKDRYPYIDLNSGGSVKGYISAVEKGLEVINEETKIIPGHGTLASKEDYSSFLKMLKYLETNIQSAIDNGVSEEDVISNESLTKTYDDLKFGSGFINSESIRKTFYQSLKSN